VAFFPFIGPFPQLFVLLFSLYLFCFPPRKLHHVFLLGILLPKPLGPFFPTSSCSGLMKASQVSLPLQNINTHHSPSFCCASTPLLGRELLPPCNDFGNSLPIPPYFPHGPPRCRLSLILFLFAPLFFPLIQPFSPTLWIFSILQNFFFFLLPLQSAHSFLEPSSLRVPPSWRGTAVLLPQGDTRIPYCRLSLSFSHVLPFSFY